MSQGEVVYNLDEQGNDFYANQMDIFVVNVFQP